MQLAVKRVIGDQAQHCSIVLYALCCSCMHENDVFLTVIPRLWDCKSCWHNADLPAKGFDLMTPEAASHIYSWFYTLVTDCDIAGISRLPTCSNGMLNRLHESMWLPAAMNDENACTGECGDPSVARHGACGNACMSGCGIPVVMECESACMSEYGLSAAMAYERAYTKRHGLPIAMDCGSACMSGPDLPAATDSMARWQPSAAEPYTRSRSRSSFASLVQSAQ